ncbi:MAG TPA: hypothetical protein VI911_10185 [Patescibacteria group bacterium]|nr:hypothetical protein [Patescibacteria group bacterium]
MIYECKCNGWMTEKECNNCFKNFKMNDYGHVKHCRRDNIVSTEDDTQEDE